MELSPNSTATTLPSMFRPPINRAMRVLDRSSFSKKVPLSAARVFENKNISKVRGDLQRSRDTLKVDRVSIVQADPDPELARKGGKCLLLRPDVRVEDQSTWSSTLHESVKAREIGVISYTLELDYNYWNYHDIMTAILPEEDQGEIPGGFSLVGHIAHLNLRAAYLPYKSLIAQVLLDKNGGVKTVINKTDDVGAESEFRTFGFEVLAGEPNLQVETREADCTFRFDYSKVYWNSRLQTEHQRLVDMFQPGEAVCDVMAGVGPFAVPAGKKGVFVWANDLNPDSYESLKDNILRNKVSQFVHPTNEDARTFIPASVNYLLSEATTPETSYVTLPVKRPSRSQNPSSTTSTTTATTTTTTYPPPPQQEPTRIPLPKTFSHYVLNLPATALSFLPSFIGLYAGHESLFHHPSDPPTSPPPPKLPMIHVHTFSTKSPDNRAETEKICKEVSGLLGAEIRPDGEDVTVWDVRDVAPLKRMFCVSFRLPPEVAFRKTKAEETEG